MENPILALAYYLPQFHPIPENDAWWGKGFTEWRSVAGARRLFRGHYQPHVPADLGFYDLRLDGIRAEQADLARQARLSGFIYWHYWLHGRELLDRPLKALLRQKEVRFPFCVAWANHDWTRRWVGGDGAVVLAQRYSPDDDLRHILALRPALTDERYVTYDGRPIIFVYRSADLPDARATTDIWREEASRWGLPGLYLVSLESAPRERRDPRPCGFDAALQHEPAWWEMPRSSARHLVARKMCRAIGSSYPVVVRYKDFAEAALKRTESSMALGYPRWPGVAVGFDNTPRYGHRRRGTVLTGATPAAYEGWLRAAIEGARQTCERFYPGPARQPLVAINAWNEWAEGMHLEPDLRYGIGFVEATQRAITEARPTGR